MRGRFLGSTFTSILLAMLASGCASRAPQSSLASDTSPDRIELNRFVEYFSVRVERAADEIGQKSDDPSIDRNTVYWKMRVIPAAQAALLGADNQAASIQLWVLSAMQKEIIDLGEPVGFGQYQAIAEQAANEIDERVRRLASSMLTPAQVDAAEASIEAFVEGRIGRTGLEFTPEEASSWSQSLSSILHKPLEVIQAPLSTLNPTSGLSDTALAMQNFTDEFSRARTEMSYMPSELRWNTQLLLMEIEERLNLSAVAGGVAQIGASADSLAETARTLPATLHTELRSFAEELSEPQSELQATMREANTTLLASQQTAQAVENMGRTLTVTFEAFTRVLATLGLVPGGASSGTSSSTPAPSASSTSAAPPKAGAPAAQPAPTEPTAPSASSAPPFNINDYGRTADKLTETAKALSALLAQAQDVSSAKQPPALLLETQATARAIVDRAALAAGALAVFVALVAFTYRLAVSRLKRA